MNEDHLRELWIKVYEYMQYACDHEVYPEWVADKVVNIVKDIYND